MCSSSEIEAYSHRHCGQGPDSPAARRGLLSRLISGISLFSGDVYGLERGCPAVRVFKGGPLLCRASAVNRSKMGQAFVIVVLINTPTVKMYLGLMSEHFHRRQGLRGPQTHSRGWWPCLSRLIAAAVGGLTPAPSATVAVLVSRDLLHRSEQAKPGCVTALLSGSGVPRLSVRPVGFSRCAKSTAKSTEIAFSDFRGADE